MRGGLSAPGVPDALAAALEMETNLVDSIFRGSNGTQSVANVYGEDYTEYVNQLTSECSRRCDFSSPRVVVILARSVDNASAVAVRLAKANGPALLPLFVDQANGNSINDRADALGWIANIAARSDALTSEQTAMIDSSLIRCVLRTCPEVVVFDAVRSIGKIVDVRADLAPNRRLAFHRAVIAATSHPDKHTRWSAVEALGAFRDTSDLALLQKLAEAEPKNLGAAAASASARIRKRVP
jgi:hypothetical protein